MRFSEWHRKLFLAIVERDRQGIRDVDAGVVAVEIGRPPPTGWVAKVVDMYVRKGFLELEPVLGLGPDRGLHVNLTGEGLEAAEAIGQPFYDGTSFDDGTGWSNDLIESDQQIPAADRFVSRSHNAEAFDAAQSALERLSAAIPESNSLFASSAERLAVSSEIEGLAKSMKSGVVRAAALIAAIIPTGLLFWLAKEAVGGVIGDLASDAIKAIGTLVGAR